MEKLYIYEGNRKREALNTKCLHCEKEFLARKSLVEQNKIKFCSKECSSGSKQIKEKCKCKVCKIEFLRSPSKLKNSKSGLYFCSKKCKDYAQSINGGIVEIQPSHYNGGKRVYREKALKHYGKKCNRCGYEKHVNILHVHHTDRNRSNNNIENLEVLCLNCHAEEHYNT